MFDKSFFEGCKISYKSTDKASIIEAIHKYINMFPQLLPLHNEGISSKLRNALEMHNMTLLDSCYFTSNELRYGWDKGYHIVLDNNSQMKTVLIQKSDNFSRISIRYSLQTPRHVHKLIVKDVYHQSFYLKCTKKLDFFINKIKNVKDFIQDGENKYVKTTNIIYNLGDNNHTNCSFIHQYLIIKYNSFCKEWSYENGQKVVRGMPSIVSYIKDHILKLSEKEKFTNDDILTIMENKKNKVIEEIQKKPAE